MRCIHCATELPEQARFCMECGARVAERVPAEDDPSPATPLMPEDSAEEDRRVTSESLRKRKRKRKKRKGTHSRRRRSLQVRRSLAIGGLTVFFVVLLLAINELMRVAPPGPEFAITGPVPFDPAMSELPPNFRGHDVDILMGAIRSFRNEASKDEYETTAEHEERRRRLEAQPLVGSSLTFQSVYAFVLPFEGLVPTEYDADLQELTAFLGDLGRQLSAENHMEFFPVVDDGFEFAYREVTLSLPPDEARQVRPNLRLLLVATLTEAAKTGSSLILPIHLDEIRVFDTRSGRTYFTSSD